MVESDLFTAISELGVPVNDRSNVVVVDVNMVLVTGNYIVVR
jgi:hypothetical protein